MLARFCKSSRFWKGFLSLSSMICHMYFFPIPGINSRACILGVIACAVLKKLMNHGSLLITIFSTVPESSILALDVKSS